MGLKPTGFLDDHHLVPIGVKLMVMLRRLGANRLRFVASGVRLARQF